MTQPEIDLRRTPAAATPDASLGELVGRATSELSTLLRKELELAKAEIREDVAVIGKGAGAFGGAGFAAYLGVFFLSLALMFGLDAVLPLWTAALVVGAAYLVAAGVLGAVGKHTLGSLPGAPRTKRTIKEDVEWARHPRS